MSSGDWTLGGGVVSRWKRCQEMRSRDVKTLDDNTLDDNTEVKTWLPAGIPTFDLGLFGKERSREK